MFRKFILFVLALALLCSPVNAEITKDDALQSLSLAEAAITDMQAMGFGVTYANDTLNEAKILLSQNRFMASDALSKKVVEIKDKAINVDKLINTAEERLYVLSEKGYDVAEAGKLFDDGFAEFELDNYIEAESMIMSALNMMDEIETMESTKRLGVNDSSGYALLIMDNLWLIIIISLSAFVALVKMRSRHTKAKIGKRLEKLGHEKEVIERRMEDAQRKYFGKGEISKKDYDVTIAKHSRRMADIIREIAVLKERLSGV